MKICKILGVATAVVCLAHSANAVYRGVFSSEAIYQYAKEGNKMMLERIKRNGYSLDMVNNKGDTALCTAMRKQDERAYNLLRKSGADIQHPCVRNVEKAMRTVHSGGMNWRIGPTTYVGALALVGGGIAIAGSGSNSSDKGNNNHHDNGMPEIPEDGGKPDVPEGGETPGEGTEDTLLTPEDFQTEEFKTGNFLGRISADVAYSRYYKANGQGGLKHELTPVKVGIVDSGVYGAHPDFAGVKISGYNFDYGPCRNGKTTNCWQWAAKLEIGGQELRNITYLKKSDGKIYLTKVGNTGTEEEYRKWASHYDLNYDWDAQQNSSTSFYPEENKSLQHGTHVAGIIAAQRDGNGMTGVAPDNTELLVSRWDMSSPMLEPTKAIIDDGAKVVNFSLGIQANNRINASLAPSLISHLTPYLDTFRYQAAHNTVFVFAAGNERYSQPSIFAGVPLLDEFKDSLKNLFVTVVALDDAKGPNANKLAYYSNRCGAAKDYCIAAPGTSVLSTVSPNNGSYMKQDGTSMAAPVVTGSVAFLMGAYPFMSSQEIVELIFETADDLGEPGVDEVYGHGALNLGNATKPQGTMTIPGESSVENQGTPIAGMSLSVPSVLKSAMLNNMPKSVTAFDKYKRPFALPMAAFVKGTHGDDRNFKNDLYAFSRYQPKKKIKSDEHVSFAYAPATMKNSPIALGTMEVEYRDEERVSGFYYTENTNYNHDTFFEKTLTNPFLAMNSAYGLYNKYNLSDELGISMGLSIGENGLYDGSRDYNDRNFDNQVYALDSSVSYQASKNLSLTAMSGMLYEDGAMLGLNGSGAFDVSNSQTYYAGIAVTWNPVEDLYLSGAYYQGRTSGGKMASDLLKTSDLSSDSFAFDGYYQYDKNSVIGLQFSSPLRVYNGRATFDVTTGRDDKSDEVYRHKFSSSLKPDAREYKFALYHTKEINEDMNVKTEFDVRLNPEHQKDAKTDYRFMFGYNWTFN